MNEVTKDVGSAPIRLFTIGFAGKSAQGFFEKLQDAGVKSLIDVRLNNVSQLAGFTKKKDLEYFLRVISGIKYFHYEDLAPTADILDRFKKKGEMDWREYDRLFNLLLEERRPEERHRPSEFDEACLLCSEATAENCHRRLVAERLRSKWGGVVIKHL
ncbi:MAG TPA: DUF488 domain-containing protein [Tepidisphaeraceae bacterium]|jgi:uncharacterized protein (DUF488 family)|nr:DUF488 domain-containing protein [Tepidisphaeraceae bacterium]